MQARRLRSPSGTLASPRARITMGLSRAGSKPWTVSPNTWQRRKHPPTARHGAGNEMQDRTKEVAVRKVVVSLDGVMEDPSGNIPEEVDKLKRQPCKDILVFSSADLR